jgi:hypothetical protein
MFDKIVDDEDMLFTIQWEHGVPFMHLDLRKWTPRVYKKCQKVLQTYLNSVNNNVYAVGLLDKTKLYKFCKLMGGVEIGKTDKSFIFIWEK